MLKLFHGCQVMTLDNADVENGIANGTTATFSYLTMVEGKKPFPIMIDGYYVNAVLAEDVASVRLQWTADSTFQGSFSVEPDTFKCTTEIRTSGKKQKIHLEMKQLPMTMNHATTGHKLQGKTVDALIVAEWAPKNVRNWIYVVLSRVKRILSRVKRIENLYLLNPLPDDIDGAPDPLLMQMMDRLRAKLGKPKDAQSIAMLRRYLINT